MNTEWDYTNLAEAYLKRPDYAQARLTRCLKFQGLKRVTVHVMLEPGRHV